MNRRLERELLDDLPADDPRAVASRRDLRRVNGLMGNAGIIARACLRSVGPLRRVVELGAGDGTLLMSLPKQFRAKEKVELKLVDQQKIVRPEVLDGYARQGWEAENVQADVFEWLEQDQPVADLVVANLFLHHFTEEQLRRLFAGAAKGAKLLVACEPRRGAFPLATTRLLWLIGCNGVTRHDAAISVRAGFDGSELSALWPGAKGWRLEEGAAGLFSHCFVARKNST